MLNVKNLSIIFLSSLLIGCSWFSKPDEVEIVTVQKSKPALNLAEPESIKPKHIEFFIITPENIDSVFEDLKSKKYNLVLFGLTDDGYENLAINMAELRSYIIEQKAIIRAYKKYYETPESK